MPSMLKRFLTGCLVVSASFAVTVTGFSATKSPSRHAAKVDPRGQILALSCAGCHGTDGKSAGIIPSFYGKSPEYLETALKEFKSGARESTVMVRHAKGYSDEEIGLIAQYFGTVWKKTK